MEIIRIEIREEDEGSRIDKVLSTSRPDLSRTQIQQWIKDGDVLVNDKKVKPNYRVKNGDLLTVDEPEPEELDIIAEDFNLDIVYEDRDVLVVNKPTRHGRPSCKVTRKWYACKWTYVSLQGLVRYKWCTTSWHCPSY